MRRLAVCLALVLGATFARGQQIQQPPVPRAGFVYPAGGRTGTTVQINVGGQFLERFVNAFLSVPLAGN